MRLSGRFVTALLLTGLALPGPAKAENRIVKWACQLALETNNDLVNYGREVWNSPYFLHTLAEAAEDSDPEHFGDLLRPPIDANAPRWWWRFTNGVRVTPIQAIEENALERPFRRVTRKFLNRTYAPGFFIKTPIYLVAFSLLFTPPYEAAFHWIMEKREAHVQQSHQPLYDTLLQHDQRFRDLRDQLSDHPQDKETTTYLALTLRSIQIDYLEKINAKRPTDYLEYFAHPLFLDLKGIANQGILPSEGFIVPPERLGRPDHKILNEVYFLEHRLQVQLEAVLQNYLKDRFLSVSQDTVLKPFFRESFWQKTLAGLHRDLSAEQVLSDLQEDLVWRTRFEQWKQLGAIRLEQDENQKWTTTPLTLNTIEKEILADP